MAAGAQAQVERPREAGVQVARVLPVMDFGRFDDAAAEGKVKALARWTALLREVPIGDSAARSMLLSVGRSNRGETLLVRGVPEQVTAVQAALAALQAEPAISVRLQCTLVTMPIAVARDHALRPGETVLGDPAAGAGLLRDAVKAKGTLHNLPEVVTGPLAPFVREPAASVGPSLRLRGEVAPLGSGEVAVGVHVVRGALPADRTQVPRTAIAQPVFRLAAGRCAMMMVAEGESALVVIVRCIEVAPDASPTGR